MAAVAIGKRQLVKMAGAARTVLEQAKLFRKIGYRVDIFAESVDQKLFAEADANFFELSCWPLKGYWQKRVFNGRASKKLSDYELSVGHSDTWRADVQFLHNCVHAAHEKIHGSPLPLNDPTGRFHREVLERQQFRLLMTNSEQMKKDVANRFQVPEEKIRVLYPGVNLEQFNDQGKAQKRSQKRKELGITDDEILIGLITSGNFKKRNVELFVQAMADLSGGLKKNARFLVVGKDKSTTYYKNKAEELGFGDRLLFINPMPDVEALHHACDVFVLPAKWEEFGRVVLEAMACRVPVVVSNQVGSAELLEGEARRFIIPPNDEKALSEKITELAQDADLRERIAALNAETAKKYSEERQAEKFYQQLKEALLLPPEKVQ